MVLQTMGAVLLTLFGITGLWSGRRHPGTKARNFLYVSWLQLVIGLVWLLYLWMKATGKAA